LISVQADSFATAERLERHLLRRASLLGCAAIVELRVQPEVAAHGVCVQRREPDLQTPGTTVVLEPSPALVNRATSAGPAGEMLLRVLAQARERPPRERAWPLRWYLENYPDSPFYADVEALLVYGVPAGAITPSASVRMAPTTP
jgi:hypothetical protein